MLQKIEHSFAEVKILVEAYNSMSQEYSPRPRGEYLLQHSTSATGSSTKSSTLAWTSHCWPSTATPGEK
jgi:hypothetical protein